jgi:hypothetical protein
MNRASTRCGALLLAWLLITACGGGSEGGSASPDDDAATTTSTTETSAPPASTGLDEFDAGIDTPRTLAYAGALVTIDRATFSNATPQSYGEADADPGDRTRLYLELSTAYAADYPGSDARFALAHLAIRSADGRAVTAHALDQSGVPIQATTTTRATVFFELEPDDVDGASLVFDDGDHEPGVLPLQGPIPDSGYPVRQAIGTSSDVVFPSGCGRSTSRVEVMGIDWDLDAGLDAEGRRVVMGRSARAANGTRMARVELDVVAGADQCGGTFVNYQNVRLSIDGVVVAPLNTPSHTLQQGEGARPVFGFEIPLDATEVTLLIGAPDDDPWAPPVEVPAGLP